jgi:hypothetical protein
MPPNTRPVTANVPQVHREDLARASDDSQTCRAASWKPTRGRPGRRRGKEEAAAAVARGEYGRRLSLNGLYIAAIETKAKAIRESRERRPGRR